MQPMKPDDPLTLPSRVFLDPTLSEGMRRASVDVATAYFDTGGFLDRAEVVVLHRSPSV